jgi:hypothetical protein
MGNRDKGGREVKKPKKKDTRELKPLSPTSALAQPIPAPEVVRKKKRVEPEEETR